MTADEVVNRIERAGGWLKLTPPDRIKVNVPADAGSLLDEVKALKPAVLEVLRQRGGWVARFPHCPRCASYALYREHNIGEYECMTCGLLGIDESTARRVM